MQDYQNDITNASLRNRRKRGVRKRSFYQRPLSRPMSLGTHQRLHEAEWVLKRGHWPLPVQHVPMWRPLVSPAGGAPVARDTAGPGCPRTFQLALRSTDETPHLPVCFYKSFDVLLDSINSVPYRYPDGKGSLERSNST
ncbi:hypothetical protein CEXT_461081 [Caerostris extrusa]|uniref:Uncharacterized protein n=1 Tax=Caerostris extrusa TaxID=172846 RepID=A0AAV4SHC8_CAEEX|nr:hypothetical protein CEXT_461081 [Caerostris extrusa]